MTAYTQPMLIYVRHDRATGELIRSSAVCSAHYYLSRGPEGVSTALPYYGDESLSCVACADRVER